MTLAHDDDTLAPADAPGTTHIRTERLTDHTTTPGTTHNTCDVQ